MRRLLIRPGAIGDLIVSLPALESLRAEYLEVWVAERNVPLIRFADTVHSIGSTGLDLLSFTPALRLVERLRNFDSIVSWYGSNQPEFRRAVEHLGLPFQFLPALSSGMRAVDFYLQQVKAPQSSAAPRIAIRRRLGKTSRSFILSPAALRNAGRSKSSSRSRAA